MVAEEIRKLAATSAESIKKIDGIIHVIQGDSGRMHNQLQQVGAAIGQIADAMTLVAGAVEQASVTAAGLDVLADSLTAE